MPRVKRKLSKKERERKEAELRYIRAEKHRGWMKPKRAPKPKSKKR